MDSTECYKLKKEIKLYMKPFDGSKKNLKFFFILLGSALESVVKNHSEHIPKFLRYICCHFIPTNLFKAMIDKCSSINYFKISLCKCVIKYEPLENILMRLNNSKQFNDEGLEDFASRIELFEYNLWISLSRDGEDSEANQKIIETSLLRGFIKNLRPNLQLVCLVKHHENIHEALEWISERSNFIIDVPHTLIAKKIQQRKWSRNQRRKIFKQKMQLRRNQKKRVYRYKN
jgi:hypothetical protein